jgi:hypothetical protein
MMPIRSRIVIDNSQSETGVPSIHGVEPRRRRGFSARNEEDAVKRATLGTPAAAGMASDTIENQPGSQAR